MATFDKSSKILIVGGGPGGLALAQILRNHDIAYELFERDSGISGRAQGWAVALIESLHDLTTLLPSDLGDIGTTSVNHGPPTPSLDTITLLNALTGERVAQLGGLPASSPGHLLRVGRERLRHFLSQHIPISYGRRFTHYTSSPSGVTAHFIDSSGKPSQAHGTLLIGAEGAHSLVRDQLLSSPPILPSTIIPIVGEVALPYDIYAPYHTCGSAAIISSTHNLRYMIGLRSITPDRSEAMYYWALCFHSSDPVRDGKWADTATKEEMFEKAMELTKGLEEFFTRIIEETGVQGMKVPPLRFREFVPTEEFPPQMDGNGKRGGLGRSVTLLGDAAHSMIPFCVAGANTALQDACDLGTGIVRGVKEEKDVASVLREYEAVMLPRGRRMVMASHGVGETGDLKSLVEGRVNTMGRAGKEKEKCGRGEVGL